MEKGGRSCPATARAPAPCRCAGPGPWAPISSKTARTSSPPTAGSTPATSRRSTRRAICASPTEPRDVIKPGGEWISTLDLEDAVCSHPAVAMAAAVGVPHPKWDERPLLLVTLRPGQTADPEDLKAHVGARVARWWTPDEVRIIEALPIGPTGKVLKRELRDQLATASPVTT